MGYPFLHTRSLRLGLRLWRDFGLLDGWAQRARREFVVPNIGDGYLVVARVAAAELGHLRAVPEAVPVGFVLEPCHLGDLVPVVLRAVDRVLGRPVAERQPRHLGDLGGEGLLAQDGRVPVEVDDSGHRYAPTSA